MSKRPIFHCCALAIILVFVSVKASGQPAAGNPNRTAADDHREMMQQLGIRALRPGPSGDEKAPNHANYDDAVANPYPNYPEILKLNDGRIVTSAEMWWKQRRPEIIEDF